MTTLLHRLADWAKTTPSAEAQRYKENSQWLSYSAEEYRNRVYWLALYLESKGVTSQDIGAIFSYNCPAWAHMELAMTLLGGKSTGIYPNTNTKDLHYILNHAQCRVLSVQNATYFKKLESLPDFIQWVIVFDGDISISPKAVAYETAIKEGKKLAAQKGVKSFQSYLDALDPDQGSFIIYTSGTTGNPKGALISQRNMAYATDVVVRHWRLSKQQGSLFSFLPLCHIAEKIQNLGAGLTLQDLVIYCSAFDNVGVELPEAKPVLLLCIPRVWEKMQEGVLKKVDEAKGAKKILAKLSFEIGKKVSQKRYSGQSLTLLDQLQWKLADRLVLGKIRAALGLEKVEVAASGAAALARHVSEWFRIIGIEILECFGQTESTAVIFLTSRGEDNGGTAGKAPEGIEVKLAEDGEVLTRGPHVFKGYFKDDQATAATLQNGWLYTGDLAENDSKGRTKIKGRKKEIIKTSGGKMIAPVPIEEELKAAPIISQVCMVGDGRKYLSALITLSDAKRAQLNGSNKTSNGVIHQPEVLKEVQNYVDQINSRLASYEQIKKFTVLSHEFTIESGEMTPSLKMKRNVIEQRYVSLINQMYE